MQEKKAQSRPDYSDLFQCERPQFDPSRKMSMKERAAQFSPFAALTGHGDVIQETERNALDRAEHEIIHTYMEGDEPWLFDPEMKQEGDTRHG